MSRRRYRVFIALRIVGGTSRFLNAAGRITSKQAGSGVNATITYRT